MKELFQTLYKASEILNSTLEPEELIAKMIDIIIESTNAERGFIITRDSIKIARNMEQKSIDECLPKSIVNKIYSEGKPVLTAEALIDPRFKGSESIMMGKIRSVCAVPFKTKDSNEIKGIIYIDSNVKRDIFNEETLKFLELLSNIASLSFVNATKFNKLRKEYKNLQSGGELIGASKTMEVVFNSIKHASAASCSVFINGESGTGKELVARAIHNYSERAEREFVPLYCGGLPESLIESELFGYKKGAFTGANNDKKGLFELADKGTLFLDEICDVPIGIQVRLLRALQEGEIRRLGDTKLLKIDTRIIAATNKDPKIEIKEKKLREDLYYRLNVLEIKLPPLRERKEDIPVLVNHFLEKYGKKYKKDKISFSEKAMEKMKNRAWQGNVRELENFVQRIMVTTEENPIPPEAIPGEIEPIGASKLEDLEKQIIVERLKLYGGNKEETAKSLGISLRTLYYKLKEWKLE